MGTAGVQAKPKARSPLEGMFLLAVRAHRVPQPVEEYRFATEQVGGSGRGLRSRLAAAGLRDWRFDFAWPSVKVAVECEGGIWNRGRHTRARGYTGDCQKYNAAAALGWTVIRVTSPMLARDPHSVCKTIRQILKGRGYRDQSERVGVEGENDGNAAGSSAHCA